MWTPERSEKLINTSGVDLEVVKVVDDRFGVLELPDVATIVPPGATFCNTDLGEVVTHIVTAEDAAAKTIQNNAVVTVSTVGGGPQAFQATDAAEVTIVAPDSPDLAPTATTTIDNVPSTGPRSLPAQLALATTFLASGWLFLVAGRRRVR